MRPKMFRPVMALVFATTFILIASMPAETAWPAFSSGMREIPTGQYFVVKDFIAQVDAGISYEVQVMFTTGPTVDVLLMDKQNFELYKSGDFFVYHSVSSLDVDFAYEDTGVGGLINGVEYLLIIDNTDRPLGGGPGNAEVRVMYSFGGSNIQTVTDWSIILIILAVVAAVVAVIVVLVIVLLRKSNGKGQIRPQTYGQPYQQPGMKACPRCGAQVPTDFTYCPRCGNRY